jgi:hypothetical protein
MKSNSNVTSKIGSVDEVGRLVGPKEATGDHFNPKDEPGASTRRRKQPKARRCQLYQDGHTVHYIQANRSAGRPHRKGQLINVDGHDITIDFGDEIKRYRNHHADQLLEVVGIGGLAKVCEEYVILRSPIDHYQNHCFSISSVDDPWVPCDFEPLRSTTPQALADRIETHGGFVVPGRSVRGVGRHE